jgi:hypothetical protein
MDFIGYEFAKENGFSVNMHSADRTWVNYINDDGIGLEISINEREELTGQMKFCWKALTIQTGNFAVPNKNFHIFYKQMVEAKFKISEGW